MNRLITGSIIVTVALAVCILDDLLSLHDIKKDYVSKSALGYLEVRASPVLPEWTDTRLEWISIKTSYILK